MPLSINIPDAYKFTAILSPLWYNVMAMFIFPQFSVKNILDKDNALTTTSN